MHRREEQSTRRRVRLLFVSCVPIAFSMAGCLTIEQMAPPVGPEFVTMGTNGVTRAVLERGRQVYLSDCTRCHSVEPINRYSADRWRAIIERMGPESKLDESRMTALEAYILAAHKVLAGEPARNNTTE